MTTSRTSAVLALGAVALGTLAFTNGAGQAAAPMVSHSSLTVETLRLEAPWQGGAFASIDLGKKGLGPGDVFVSSDLPVSDTSTGKKVGSMDGWEIILSAHHNGTVAGTIMLHLAGGNVIVDGTVRHTDNPNIFAVTGGTGSYVGAGGTLAIRENTHRKVNIMRLEIVR